MTVKIKVEHNKEDLNLLDPCEIFNNTFEHGTVFQEYCHQVPQPKYYICCGPYEDSVITIWYCNEECKYRFSTDNLASLKELVSYVKVKQCDTNIKMKVLVNES